MRTLAPSSLLLMLAIFAGSPTPAHSQEVDHRAGGMVFDAFTLTVDDDWYQWVVEDARIRFRVNDDQWVFQDVPDEAAHLLRRIHFMDDTQTGWAVGRNGTLLWTEDGGDTWNYKQIRTGLDGDPDDPFQNSGDPVELWDVYFFDSRGWLLGDQQAWWTDDLGDEWNPVTLPSMSYTVEYYALDVAVRPNGDLLGLICGEPGLVLRAQGPWSTTTLEDWDEVVLDMDDICSMTLPTCASAELCEFSDPPGTGVYEPWDIDIVVDGQDEMVVMVGGVTVQCGLAFSSVDGGGTWARDTHYCETNTCTTGYYCFSTTGSSAKHCEIKELYGVGAFQSGTAVAVGYNGQQVRRRPADAFTSPGIWEDFSEFAAVLDFPDAVTAPLFGAETNEGPNSLERVLVTGYGGYIRESDDSGQTYANTKGALNHTGPTGPDLPHDPWRLRAIYAQSPTIVWRAGQLGRIARSNNAGYISSSQEPHAQITSNYINALAFKGDNAKAVAVGDLGSATHLLYNEDIVGLDTWESGSINDSATYHGLLDVAWAGSDSYVAVGKSGFILGTGTGGLTWNILTPPDYTTNLSAFTIHSVACIPPSGGSSAVVFYVGVRPHPDLTTDPHHGVAYMQTSSGGTLSWAQLSPTTSGLNVLRLTGVALDGTTAWAVGEQLVGSEVRGVVLKSVLQAGTQQPFVVETSAPTFPRCTVGEPTDVEGFPVLSCVAVAPGGDVFVAGGCGAVWRAQPSGSSYVWTQVQSMTSIHVRDMSFVADGSGYVGFLACHRESETMGHAIVRITSD